MTLHVCPIPTCPTLSPHPGPCPTHAADKRRRRGTTTAQGYGWQHQRTRARLLRALALAPGQPCPMCGDPMLPGQPVDLDHTTPISISPQSKGDRLVHATCNRAAGGRIGHTNRSM